MQTLLISACLFGCRCRYDGKSSEDKIPAQTLSALRKKFILIPVCPEQLGGLPTPRPPAEIKQKDGSTKVINTEGLDVTENYIRGAEETLKIALKSGCGYALLKERSPSCGHGKIYDGTFTSTLVPGSGITAKLLSENGIAVAGESSADELLLQTTPQTEKAACKTDVIQ